MNQTFVRRLLVGLLLLAAAWIGYDYVQLALYSEGEQRAVTARGELADAEQTAIEVFERASPSVVFVTTVAQPRLQLFRSGSATVGMGSGFAWDAAGHIVTNHHVVQGADQIGVRFGAEEMQRAVVIGSAPDYDLAVLRLQHANRTYEPISIGTSRDLRVGQAVFAIGNPYGLTRTLTQGMVSALGRHLPTPTGREIEGVIQTDAAINPGNSGGPLLDSAGRLIGVNTAIVSGDGSFAGVGFAVPIDVVNRVVSTLIREGRVARPGIGITALGQRVAARLGVEGVVVAEVVPGSPAAKAGLAGIDVEARELGDVITHAEEMRVRSVADLAEVLEEVGIGNEASLEVKRGESGRTIEVAVVDIFALEAGGD